MSAIKPARPAKADTELDPLYVIFEEHLLNVQDPEVDRKTFVLNIAHAYLLHLRKSKVVIPKTLERAVVEELSIQINQMLLKKTYGYTSVDEFQKKQPAAAKEAARNRFKRLRRN